MKKNLFTILAVFCVFGLGLVTTVGTGADDIIADIVGDITVEEDVDLDLELAVDSAAGDGFLPASRAVEFVDECETDTVANLIADVNWGDYGVDDRLTVTVNSINLNAVQAFYRNATWTADPPVADPNITCTVQALDPADDSVLDEIIQEEVIRASGASWVGVTLDDPVTTKALINEYFTTKQNETFKFCVTCSSDAESVTDFSLEWRVRLSSRIVATGSL